MVCDAMDTAEEVAVCDADEEAAAELAACKAAAPWAFCAPEPLAKTPSKEAVATTWAVTTCSE